MSIYYNYALYRTKNVVLSYVDDCVYWYTSEHIGKWFVYTLRNRLHVNFLLYAHWSMSIIISQMKDNYISGYQDMYATAIVAKYLDTSAINTSEFFYKTTLSSGMIFAKADVYASDEQVEKWTMEFNIHYRYCIGSLINFLYTRVDFIFAVNKLAKFSSNTGKVQFECLVRVLR